MKHMIATLLIATSFSAHAFKGIDTELNQRSIEAASVHIRVDSNNRKVEKMVTSHTLMAARETIRNSISVTSLGDRRNMAWTVATGLYYKGILVDTVTIDANFETTKFQFEVFPKATMTEITDLPVDLFK